MTQRDNWGWQARIGMFIVGSEVVPEAEWWAMVPLNVSVVMLPLMTGSLIVPDQDVTRAGNSGTSR